MADKTIVDKIFRSPFLQDFKEIIETLKLD